MFEWDHLLRDSKLILCAPYLIPSQPTVVALFVLIHRTQNEVRKENLAMLCACEPRENWGPIPRGCHWSYASDREERNLDQSCRPWPTTNLCICDQVIWWNPAKRINTLSGTPSQCMNPCASRSLCAHAHIPTCSLALSPKKSVL